MHGDIYVLYVTYIGTCTQTYIESIMLLYDIYCQCMASRARIWDMYVCWVENASPHILWHMRPIRGVDHDIYVTNYPYMATYMLYVGQYRDMHPDIH